jgi:hypothetical protein
MFKKIAHSSNLPSLGNRDLKSLQDLIHTEKSVLITLQKLSVDLSKSSDALKTWGLGEGEDLGVGAFAMRRIKIDFRNLGCPHTQCLYFVSCFKRTFRLRLTRADREGTTQIHSIQRGKVGRDKKQAKGSW